MENETPIMQAKLGNILITDFLQEYWQQKPLLIRKAMPNYECPVSADEMAGLACEAEVESRIILERDGDYPWQCHQGPFDEAVFSTLPETHWTLLLQSCNIYLPQFAQLLEQFRFIPNWRVDDIMVSYAAPEGSVGPHTDNYDVFLLQAQGQRRWQISTHTNNEANFLPDLDLKILKSFSAEQTWVLDPGDILYLPPGVAHYGVAQQGVTEDCITISIGFRAPDATELCTALLDEVLEQEMAIKNNDFYQDPHFPSQENSGEISAWALNRIKTMLRQALDTKIENNDWFGKYITHVSDTSDNLLTQLTQSQCLQNLKEGKQLVRNESSKLAFIVEKGINDNEQTIHFYYNGEMRISPTTLLPLIKLLCNDRYPPIDLLSKTLSSDAEKSLLCDLINQGHFYFETD